MDRVGIGVLSHAHGHINTYCGVMKDFDDVELVATWDDNPDRAAHASSSWGLNVCRTPEEVVNHPDVHAVMIGSETNRHADFVELAAGAGKHILLQKPMATTLADCDRIIEAVNRSGVKFSMAFQMRQDPVNRKIKRLLDEGAVGNVAMVRRRHAIGVLLDPNFIGGPSRWHIDPVANVGMFFDDATHAADWFYWMLGKPTSVIAEVGNVVTDCAPDDNGAAIYRFAKGEMGILLNSSTTVAAVNTTEIYGDEGSIVQDWGDGPSSFPPRPAGLAPLRLWRKGGSDWDGFDLPSPANHGERIAAVPRPFIDYVRGLSAERVSPEDGRVSVQMILAAYRAAGEGRRVSMDETA